MLLITLHTQNVQCYLIVKPISKLLRIGSYTDPLSYPHGVSKARQILNVERVFLGHDKDLTTINHYRFILPNSLNLREDESVDFFDVVRFIRYNLYEIAELDEETDDLPNYNKGEVRKINATITQRLEAHYVGCKKVSGLIVNFEI